MKEIKGGKAAIYSWRDLCNDMESDDREVRRAAIRILQRLEECGQIEVLNENLKFR